MSIPEVLSTYEQRINELQTCLLKLERVCETDSGTFFPEASNQELLDGNRFFG
jgi:hypothetical protein